MRNRLDPFQLLERTDKGGLSGGKASQYAPIFPRFADVPGFWDRASFADLSLERLYTVLLVGTDGSPLKLRLASRRWNPASLTHLYTVEGYPTLLIREERVISPLDTFVSRLTITNRGDTTLDLHWLLWSLQIQQQLSDNNTYSTLTDLLPEPDLLAFSQTTRYAGKGETPAFVGGWGERETDEKSPREATLYVALGASRLPDSVCILAAEPGETLPLWEISPASDRFRDGRLLDCPASFFDDGFTGEHPRHLHLMQHYAVEVQPGGSDTVTFGASVALSHEDATDDLRRDLAGDPVSSAKEDWQAWFDAAPAFECSDPFLERAYWYRVFLLKFNAVRIGVAPLVHPCVFEGVGGFRSHVSYSSTATARDAVSLDSELAKGCLLNLLEAQIGSNPEDETNEEYGFIPGHLYLNRRDRGFYHADWGGAAERIYHLTGDLDFVRQVTPALVRYAEYLDRHRDHENSGLYDLVDQGESGQEYSPRYGFVSDHADRWGKFRLKGVDATCYAAGLQRTLSLFSRLLGEREDAAYWLERAETTAASVRELMWDAEQSFFVDVHPTNGQRSPHRAAVGFYPLLFDIATAEQTTALLTHLEEGGDFNTPFPVPTLSKENPDFSSVGDWHGVRTACPWNGRVWPMTNAHIISGLAKAARRFENVEARSLAGSLLLKHARMMFHQGDPTRPNAFEHYHPITGQPASHRGVDDYLHSWLLALLIEIVAGIVPEPGTNGALVLDPLNLSLERFRFEGIPVRGHRVDVIWSLSEGFVVKIDGVERVQLPSLQRVEIPL